MILFTPKYASRWWIRTWKSLFHSKQITIYWHPTGTKKMKWKELMHTNTSRWHGWSRYSGFQIPEATDNHTLICAPKLTGELTVTLLPVMPITCKCLRQNYEETANIWASIEAFGRDNCGSALLITLDASRRGRRAESGGFSNIIKIELHRRLLLQRMAPAD